MTRQCLCQDTHFGFYHPPKYLYNGMVDGSVMHAPMANEVIYQELFCSPWEIELVLGTLTHKARQISSTHFLQLCTDSCTHLERL